MNISTKLTTIPQGHTAASIPAVLSWNLFEYSGPSCTQLTMIHHHFWPEVVHPLSMECSGSTLLPCELLRSLFLLQVAVFCTKLRWCLVATSHNRSVRTALSYVQTACFTNPASNSSLLRKGTHWSTNLQIFSRPSSEA